MTADEIASTLLQAIALPPAALAGQDLGSLVAAVCHEQFPGVDDQTIRQALRVTASTLQERRNVAAAPPTEIASLRRVRPIKVTGLDLGEPVNGEPICERVDPATLFIDPAYQRDIAERGLRQIQRIVEAWDWNKFKPPICAYAKHDGHTVLKVLDGQHTAIAAASHPRIDMIPIMIVDAAETAVQAAAFVGQNTQRLPVSPLQLHHAALTAQDEDALTIQQVCDRAGVTILRYSTKTFEAGQTVALSAISTLIDARGAMKARIILEALVRAGMAPILAPQIKAAEALLYDPEYAPEISVEDLSGLSQASWRADHDEAKLFAATHRLPFWKGLTVVWFQKLRKRRPRAGRPLP